jgi:hypothetical protein
MKKSQLRQIIKEEISRIIEADSLRPQLQLQQNLQ